MLMILLLSKTWRNCHMNFVRDIHARALDVRNDDQYTMEDLHNKLFPKTRRGKRGINTILLPPRRNPATNVLLSWSVRNMEIVIKKKKGMIKDFTLVVNFYAMPRPRLRMLRARRALFLQQDCSLWTLPQNGQSQEVNIVAMKKSVRWVRERRAGVQGLSSQPA